MTDFEKRLSQALADGAEGAPGVGTLAEGARRRSRVRRRRAGALVGAVAIVAIAVPMGVVVGDDDGPDPGRVVARAEAGWQTVELPGVSYLKDREPEPLLVDVPATWVESDVDECSFLLWAPPGSKECTEGLSVLGGATFDARFGPGLRPAADYDVEGEWLGYVRRGDSVVDVASDDQQVALRILGSARSPGDASTDLSGEWPVVVEGGVSYQAPPLVDGYAVMVGEQRRAAEVGYAEEVVTGRWRAAATVGDDRRIQVDAPTQALAELVAGSARAAAGEWRSVTVLGVTMELPSDWVALDESACPGSVLDLYGPSGTDPCEDPDDIPLFVYDEPVDFSGPVGLGAEGGRVDVGDVGVAVFEVEREVARHILASARSVDAPAPDVDLWTTRSLDDEYAADDEVTAEVPEGVGVEVRVLKGLPDCATSRTPAKPLPNGQWRASLCRDRIVTVTAPTQALADVVASTVRGF